MSYKTINIVGSGYSGSSAIYEFLRKTKLFYDPFQDSQLSITYDPGGLIDLENIIKDQFTVNKTRLAYTNFKRLIDYYCIKSKGLKSGKNLIEYNNDLRNILENYINNIINIKFKGETSFINFQKNKLETLKFKIISRYYNFINKRRNNLDELYIFCDIQKFKSETDNLIFKLVEKKNFLKKDVILDQAGTIFNPVSSLKFFRNPLSICILRDPRDVFSEIKNITNKFPAYDVKVFVSWYQKIMEKINIEEKVDKKVLFINFEDFILNKEDTTNKIFGFIGKEKPLVKNVQFDFLKSEKNISIHKKFLKKEEANYIENNLKEYLYNF